jgi:hypothetical protein
MKSNRIFQGASMLLTALFIMSMTASPVGHSILDPVGDWEYEVAMPDGTSLSGDMKISKNDGELAVVIYSDVYGEMNLNDVEMDGSTIEATYEVEGDSIEFVMEFDGDSMEGIIYTGDGEIEISAEKKK